MTRLANLEKIGYFPCPPLVTTQIASHISAPHGGRMLDPCAGEGTALVTLARTLNLLPYGVELHEERAETARSAIADYLAATAPESVDATHLIADSYTHLVTSRNGFNLLYLNPPYDYDDADGRLEYQWLWRTRPYLQPGGLLVYVVPQHILKLRKAANYLAAHFEQLRIYRFPDGEYERFRQVVVFGVRRAQSVTPDGDLVQQLRVWGDVAEGGLLTGPPLPVLTPADQPLYTLPPLAVKSAQLVFRSQFVDPETALTEAQRVGAATTAGWRQHLDPAAVALPLRPLTPLKIGHMHSIIAAGHLNNQLLTAAHAEEGQNTDERLLIKGRSYKRLRQDSYTEPLDDGGSRLVQTETEVVVTDITTLAADGDIQSYQGTDLEQFLTRWIEPLTQIVARTYTPVYRFDLNGYGKLLNGLSKQRPIPGLGGQTGLLPAQKHAAAAILTRLEHHPDALLVGEMGSGKAQPLDSKVLTPAGWKQMGDMQVGDEVIDPAGGTARVIGVFPQGEKAIYRVTFSDGAQAECCDDHLWQVLTPERKWRGHPPRVVALREIRDRLYSRSNNARYFIPLVAPVDFPAQPLPLDPYLLGLLIGDGTLSSQSSPGFTTTDAELICAVSSLLPAGVTAQPVTAFDYRLSSTRNSNPNPLTVALRELGLMGCRANTKFIPDQYLYAATADRIALLQGLLDSDGTVRRTGDARAGSVSYTTVSSRLAQNVIALVQSLGGTASVSTRVTYYTHNGEKRAGQMSYRMGVKLPNTIQPFRLARKRRHVAPRSKYFPTRALVDVRYVGHKQAQCIALESDSQLYVTDDFIVTHNTTIGAAIAAGRHAQRTVILCPPHLVDKWQRECRAVWPGVVTMHLQTISDVDAFFADRRDGRPVIGVLKQTSARSASGWEHAYVYGGAAAHDYGSNGFNDVRRWWSDQITAVKAAKKGETTLTPRQLQAIHERGVACPICGAQQETNGRPLSPSELKSARRRCSNDVCGQPLYQFKRRRSGGQVAGSFGRYAERERAIRSGTPLPDLPLPRELHGYAKTPLAGYIKRMARGRLDLVLIDEGHEYKGSDSDQGYAMHHLAQAACKTVLLTGTIYGGKASSLFHLLYRTAPALVHAYTDSAASGTRRIRSQDWVASYGILQRIETTRLDEHGRQTANSRSSVRYKELPGGSPAMLPWLLNRSVFLALGDMGFPLPEYSEIPIEVPMAAEQALLYESLKAQLTQVLKERLVRGDKSLLAGYLYALLFWPDAPRRAKVVRDPRTDEIVASIPGLDNDFVGPKETAIIELCQQEKAAGRKVLLLCLQTDTLDIQPEWQQMLGNAGLQTAVLRAAPNQREGWVERQVAAGVDVVISHPKKIETGIDLLDFATIVWMAPHYSVYTVLQASRRSWRIGQTQPVKVYYFAYAETIQADALYLVAAKVAAALRVNGDTVADDSLADLDDLAGGDIVATLAKIVTGDSTLTTHSLQQAFAEANAALRQTNTIIGEYTLVDDVDANEADTETEAPMLAESVQETLPAPTVVQQPSLLSPAQEMTSAPAPSSPPATDTEEQPPQQVKPAKPPVPRPRLLLNF